MATTITMQTVIILFFMLCDINDVFYIGCSIWLKITRLLWITYIWNDFFYSDAIREADNHFLWLGKIKYRTQSRLVEHDILSALLLSRRERASHFLASKCRRLGGTWAFSMSSYLFLITKQAWGLLDFDHKNDSIPSFDMIFSCRHRILETFRLGCFFVLCFWIQGWGRVTFVNHFSASKCRQQGKNRVWGVKSVNVKNGVGQTIFEYGCHGYKR